MARSEIILHPLLPGMIGTASQKKPEELDRFGEENVIPKTNLSSSFNELETKTAQEIQIPFYLTYS